MNDKIIPFRKRTRIQKIKKVFNESYLPKLKTGFNKIIGAKRMLFLVIIVGSLVGLLVWHHFVENVARADVDVPISQNITYNNEIARAISSANLNDDFEAVQTGPVLLYLYTSWCSKCKKYTPIINELAREFQNTDLKVLAIAIDRNISSKDLNDYLNKFGDIYFEPKYLYSKEGFISFLKSKGVKYNKRIPYTALFSVDREVIASFSGVKTKNYLRNRIIKELNL
ncbi:MAG: redoxin domain-containing protein [Rickettsiales bacterium]|nr:redoxin domain-containing protein [Rickettsiales bacterium]